MSDDFLPKAICNDKNKVEEEYEQGGVVITFLVCTVFIPFFFILLLVMVIRSLRAPIRVRLTTPTNFPNVAAFALTGLILSLFIIGMDIAAVIVSIVGEKELSGHVYSTYFVYVTITADALIMVLSFGGLFLSSPAGMLRREIMLRMLSYMS